MRVFATRVWGFSPSTWPIASFGSEGICANLLKQSDPGDILVSVGTKGPPTASREQGRILGYGVFGREIVDTLKILKQEVIGPEAFDEKGRFRWPKSMVLTQAWQVDLDPLPDLVDTIGRQIPRLATTYAVPLSDGEAERILALPVCEVELKGTKFFGDLRLKAERLRARTVGPVPGSGKRSAVESAPQRRAYTYAFRFEGTNCFKIGWAYDWKARLNEVNAHVPVEVLGRRWVRCLFEEWDSAKDAYAMEQRVLDSMDQSKLVGERIQIDATALETRWAKAKVT